MPLKVYPGKCFPLGATVCEGGINFSVFSVSASELEILLFESADSPAPYQTIGLKDSQHRTYGYWHAFVQGIGSGQVYAFRAKGPYDPALGFRFDASKVLLDPYGKFVVGWDKYRREAAMEAGDNCAEALRSVAVDISGYDWEGDTQLRTPFGESVIYELHVGAFTKNPNSGVAEPKRGTFAGLVDKIPYLKELRVTAVELMPVQGFDECDAMPGLKNCWGYSPLAFFAPHFRYCQASGALAAINEFRDMVKAFHRAGIEVILDVVFNHTTEGDEHGPTLSLRGLDNQTYYLLDRTDSSLYKDFSGCGNTLRANHPIVGRLIMDSLKYWVMEMHVDGFRFDLASALGRDAFGEPAERTPILWSIESDPVLAGAKLIAEAWDAAGLYQVGKFVNVGRWYAEWNGPYRDDVRKFVKGEIGTVKNLSLRISGSSDIYVRPGHDLGRSINFIACHDGFTLNDLVSYNNKHNELNLDHNRDGANANFSWNCGIEGETDNADVEELRVRQIKNLLTILFVSYGTPMLLMGDEVRRTQKGNNNAYCQDNPLFWFDWDKTKSNASLLRFTRILIHYARTLQLLRLKEALLSSQSTVSPYVVWHGVKLGCPDFSDQSHSLAFSMLHETHCEHLHVLLNAYWQPLDFELPKCKFGSWHRIIDTSLPSPEDILEPADAVAMRDSHYLLKARSAAVLFAK